MDTGTFYATTFSSTSGRTHIYRTRDIEKGPWVENSFRPSLHDHSLFFDDDGRVYMLYGGGNLRLVELNENLSGLKEGGFHQVVITNAHSVVTTNVGLVARRNTRSAIDDRRNHFEPRVRSAPITIKSTARELACRSMIPGGSPCCTTVRTVTPACSARLLSSEVRSRRLLAPTENAWFAGTA